MPLRRIPDRCWTESPAVDVYFDKTYVEPILHNECLDDVFVVYCQHSFCCWIIDADRRLRFVAHEPRVDKTQKLNRHLNK